MMAPFACFVDSTETAFTDPGEDAIATGQQDTGLERSVHGCTLMNCNTCSLVYTTDEGCMYQIP